jgi:hypothetical protein
MESENSSHSGTKTEQALMWLCSVLVVPLLDHLKPMQGFEFIFKRLKLVFLSIMTQFT